LERCADQNQHPQEAPAAENHFDNRALHQRWF
jgi:hypothetical protein